MTKSLAKHVHKEPTKIKLSLIDKLFFQVTINSIRFLINKEGSNIKTENYKNYLKVSAFNYKSLKVLNFRLLEKFNKQEEKADFINYSLYTQMVLNLEFIKSKLIKRL